VPRNRGIAWNTYDVSLFVGFASLQTAPNQMS
jgi:hypothetical protein